MSLRFEADQIGQTITSLRPDLEGAVITPRPAQRLVGLELSGRWKVLQQIKHTANHTGGTFSSGYLVESATGQRAYLKALDYQEAFNAPDTASALNALTSAYLHERELCLKCTNRKLSRVVRAIDFGKVTLSDDPKYGVVEFLVFELAKCDIRAQLDAFQSFETALALRSLHHVATGLKQLHGIGVAHQDVKPSNILVFDHIGSKLSDLGRASYNGSQQTHDSLHCAGDLTYAPPEHLYGLCSSEWNVRRFGCDVYLLGSMVVFFFCRASMTSLILNWIPDVLCWRTFSGQYDDILPYIRSAFNDAIDSLSPSFPLPFRDELVNIVRQLCEPDPRLRGNPQDRCAQQFSLHRYISAFDRLAARAEYNL